MKKLLNTLFMLMGVLNGYSQLQFIDYSKTLLIEPSFFTTELDELTNYYIEEYLFLIDELELTYETETDFEKIDQINEDLKKLKEVLELWTENNNGKLYSFLVNYSQENCYEIETSQGILKNEDIQIQIHWDKDSTFLITEKIEFETEDFKEWQKRKKHENCFSEKPEDCYVAVLVEGKNYFLKHKGQELSIGTLPPMNFELNSSFNLFENEIELNPIQFGIHDKDGNVLEVYSWKEIDCN